MRVTKNQAIAQCAILFKYDMVAKSIIRGDNLSVTVNYVP